MISPFGTTTRLPRRVALCAVHSTRVGWLSACSVKRGLFFFSFLGLSWAFLFFVLSFLGLHFPESVTVGASRPERSCYCSMHALMPLMSFCAFPPLASRRPAFLSRQALFSFVLGASIQFTRNQDIGAGRTSERTSCEQAPRLSELRAQDGGIKRSVDDR
ncbi:hypothetical protein GALMADRAFT_871806 [Galerina marginata CBS 339.88]|uniref:Transmembrane protein n=1 Tax=Galerina marginata (strain CBS 339.88) TaxID=685588 RepID=A0A067TLA6_GALM3|nr:hypothetical protein GALMADRAFT_871806 [Galerina marginata CBS 339.88]